MTPSGEVRIGEQLELDSRTVALLRSNRIELGRLAYTSDDELLAIQGIGPTRLRRIRWALLRYELERPAPVATVEDIAADEASARRVIDVLRREAHLRHGRVLGNAWTAMADLIERDYPAPRVERTRT